MSILTQEILRRVVGCRASAADLTRLPAIYRYAGGGVAGRLAAAGLLRLALRWPTLALVVVLSMLATRILSGRRPRPDEASPARGGARVRPGRDLARSG